MSVSRLLFLCVSSSLCVSYIFSAAATSVCVTCPILRLILPVLTFLRWQWKADDGRAGQDYRAGVPPSLTTFPSGHNPQNVHVGPIIGIRENFASSMPRHMWSIFGIPEDSVRPNLNWGYVGRWNNQKLSCLKCFGVNRPIWDEQPIIATKIANF